MFSFTTLNFSNLWREWRTVGGVLLFSMIFVGFCMFFFLKFGGIPLYHVMRSRSWVACPGVVTESYREEIFRGILVHMHYEYFWQNQKMEGNQYDFFLSNISCGDCGDRMVGKIVESFRPGRKIKCLVNPETPSEAVVTRSIPWVAWGGILLPLLIMLGEIFVALLIIFAILKEEQPSSKMIQETKNHP